MMREATADGGHIDQKIRVEDDMLRQQGTVLLTLGKQQIQRRANVEIGRRDKVGVAHGEAVAEDGIVRPTLNIDALQLDGL